MTRPIATGRATGELNIKRCYLPGMAIEATCPECGRRVTDNLGGRYLSYPTVGEWVTHDMYCYTEGEGDTPDAEHEWEIEIFICISIEARTTAMGAL